MTMGKNDHERVITMMRLIEPYKSNWDNTEDILESERANSD